jgi:hypothetical protein
MDVFKIKDLTPDMRRELFVNEAFATEELQFMKPLEETELAALKDELAQTAIKRSMLEDEMATVMEDYKARIKPLKEKFAETLDAIKLKAVDALGTVYLMQDFDNQMIHYVSEDGTVINSRRMKPEERQTRFRIESANVERSTFGETRVANG